MLGAEASTFVDRAVTPEDDDVSRFVAQLRDRVRARRRVLLVTLGLEILTVDSNDPPSSDAKYPDLTRLQLVFYKRPFHNGIIGA